MIILRQRYYAVGEKFDKALAIGANPTVASLAPIVAAPVIGGISNAIAERKERKRRQLEKQFVAPAIIAAGSRLASMLPKLGKVAEGANAAGMIAQGAANTKEGIGRLKTTEKESSFSEDGGSVLAEAKNIFNPLKGGLPGLAARSTVKGIKSLGDQAN